MLLANNRFFLPFHLNAFVSFSGLIAVAGTMLPKSGESGHSCLVPDLLAFSTLSLMLAVCLS